jgi:hypothetical protein
MNTTHAWPDYTEYAFRTFYYGGQYEEQLEAFAQRWGNFDLQTLMHVLKVGTDEEKVLALLALGYSNVPQGRATLLPYLQSAKPMERWASALCLGEMREEQAFPILVQTLNEFLPPQMHPLEREGGLYNFWRIKAVSLLAAWGRNKVVPVLRQALVKGWEFEQVEQNKRKQIWHPYQDELVYALGQLGAFGVLSDISFPSAPLHLWIVTLACGSLQARTHYGDVLTQIQINQTLKDAVAQVLEQRFGLSTKEQVEYIDQYVDEYFARME